MELRGRTLFREGPPGRGYCTEERSDVECDRVLTKVLSGYNYGRGHVALGGAIDPSIEADSVRGRGRGVAALRVALASADLAGGQIELGAVDAVLGDRQTHRVRVTLVDAPSLFFCRDAESGRLVAPVIGMFTRACRPDAILALDVGALAAQWDLGTNRLIGEWLRFGPALELLGNGFAYAHLGRSIQVGIPFDVRSLHYGSRVAGVETSIGAGLRLAAMYRTPHWEARLVARHRTALAGGAGALRDHNAEGELKLLHNFFFTDAVVVQAGLSVRASYSSRPERTFAVWARSDHRYSGFVGMVVGWVHEPPGI